MNVEAGFPHFGMTRLEVRLQDETVWLTQNMMAELYQTTKQNIGQHLKNIFSEGELTETSIVKKFFTTATDGKEYKTNLYNLDAIISVGYRVRSGVATRFRAFAERRRLAEEAEAEKRYVEDLRTSAKMLEAGRGKQPAKSQSKGRSKGAEADDE